MIDRKALLEIAKLSGLKPWQQEKHYVQALILTILAEQPVVLKGGTYLWLFHGLRRFSEDLDFSTLEKLPKDLPEIVSKSLELFGVENMQKTITDNNITLSFRISAKGPLNTGKIDECRTYLEISKREKPLKKPLLLKLDFPEYALPIKQVQGMDLEEVGAEKVRAILTRQKARDLYDLFYLIKNKKIGFDEELANKKLEYYNKTFSKKELFQQIKNKQKYFPKELGSIVLDELPKFSECQATIKKWVKK